MGVVSEKVQHETLVIDVEGEQQGAWNYSPFQLIRSWEDVSSQSGWMHIGLRMTVTEVESKYNEQRHSLVATPFL